MVALIDTNVIIDFIIKRQPFEKESTEVMKKCASREIQGFVAFHSISNLWYILRKMPENERREWLVNVCKCLTVVGADHDEVINAIKKVILKILRIVYRINVLSESMQIILLLEM